MQFAQGKASCEWIGAKEINELARSTDPNTMQRLRAAEQCLRDARGLLGEAGVQEQPHVDNELCSKLTKLDCNMGRLILGRQEFNAVKYSGVAEVARAFEADLKASFAHVNLDVFKKHNFGEGDIAIAAPPKAKAPSAPPASSSAPELFLYELDTSGHAVSPLAVLRKHGFDVGARVTLKPSAPTDTSAELPLGGLAQDRRSHGQQRGFGGVGQ